MTRRSENNVGAIISIIALATTCTVVTSNSIITTANDGNDDLDLGWQNDIARQDGSQNRESPFNPFYSDELISSEEEYGNGTNNDLTITQDDYLEWDLLIFTQQWPVTSCFNWKEEDISHKCALPTEQVSWTIHGIWPTKLGHMGPNFCNKTADFNVTQLEDIRGQLDQFWPTIHGGPHDHSDDLWKHEWLKHGTCASLLARLNNELKYFAQGLLWRDSFLLTSILGNSGIYPNSDNTIGALHTALVKVLGRNPSIHCVYDTKDDIQYLLEIRICFDKQLRLVDCDGVKLGDTMQVNYPGGTINTNCHVSKPVHYPSVVPPIEPALTREWKFPVVNVYKLLQFIMWFTL